MTHLLATVTIEKAVNEDGVEIVPEVEYLDGVVR